MDLLLVHIMVRYKVQIAFWGAPHRSAACRPPRAPRAWTRPSTPQQFEVIRAIMLENSPQQFEVIRAVMLENSPWAHSPR